MASLNNSSHHTHCPLLTGSSTPAPRRMSLVTQSLQHVQPHPFSSTITIGNGSRLPVTHTALSSIPTKLHNLSMRNILISSDLVENLISVRQLTCNNLVSVKFDPFSFFHYGSTHQDEDSALWQPWRSLPSEATTIRISCCLYSGRCWDIPAVTVFFRLYVPSSSILLVIIQIIILVRHVALANMFIYHLHLLCILVFFPFNWYMPMCGLLLFWATLAFNTILSLSTITLIIRGRSRCVARVRFSLTFVVFIHMFKPNIACRSSPSKQTMARSLIISPFAHSSTLMAFSYAFFAHTIHLKTGKPNVSSTHSMTPSWPCSCTLMLQHLSGRNSSNCNLFNQPTSMSSYQSSHTLRTAPWHAPHLWQSSCFRVYLISKSDNDKGKQALRPICSMRLLGLSRWP